MVWFPDNSSQQQSTTRVGRQEQDPPPSFLKLVRTPLAAGAPPDPARRHRRHHHPRPPSRPGAAASRQRPPFRLNSPSPTPAPTPPALVRCGGRCCRPALASSSATAPRTAARHLQGSAPLRLASARGADDGDGDAAGSALAPARLGFSAVPGRASAAADTGVAVGIGHRLGVGFYSVGSHQLRN